MGFSITNNNLANILLSEVAIEVKFLEKPLQYGLILSTLGPPSSGRGVRAQEAPEKDGDVEKMCDLALPCPFYAYIYVSA